MTEKEFWEKWDTETVNFFDKWQSKINDPSLDASALKTIREQCIAEVEQWKINMNEEFSLIVKGIAP